MSSVESEYDHLMKDCNEDLFHIQNYLDHKKQIQGTRHNPDFTYDMIGKIIY